MRAFATSSESLRSAIRRFLAWLRVSLATTRTVLSSPSLDASFDSKRSRCSSVIAFDSFTFQAIATRDDVLLTCWPPAPDERDTVMIISSRGISNIRYQIPDTRASVSSPPPEQLECCNEAHEKPGRDNGHL